VTHAYDESYVRLARASLARAFDYAVNDEQLDLDVFCSLFVSSGVARRFQNGDARTIAGQSGVELARETLAGTPGYRPAPARYATGRSPEYWTGWALAYYQWFAGLSFRRIFSAVPASTIIDLYHPYHEMDIAHFVERMGALMRDAERQPRLAWYRQRMGLTQRELAERSGIPVRSIQQYEQRQKHINRAGFETVIALARALNCTDPCDLLELDPVPPVRAAQ